MGYWNSWEGQLWAFPWATNHCFWPFFSSRRGGNREGFSETGEQVGLCLCKHLMCCRRKQMANLCSCRGIIHNKYNQFFSVSQKGRLLVVLRGLFLQEFHPSQGQQMLRIWGLIWCWKDSSLLIWIFFLKYFLSEVEVNTFCWFIRAGKGCSNPQVVVCINGGLKWQRLGDHIKKCRDVSDILGTW